MSLAVSEGGGRCRVRVGAVGATGWPVRVDQCRHAAGLTFRILGPLEASHDGVRLDLGGLRDQRVLAALVLDVGRVVPLDRITGLLWPENPPATASKQIRNAVSRLRAVLADAGATNIIMTYPGGYRLCVADEGVDARVFGKMLAQARGAVMAGQAKEALGLLTWALGLWRGPVLAGLADHGSYAATVAWEERRCAARELFYEQQLALGRHADALPELAELASEYPLRSTPARLLMLALYRSGRQGEALAVYERTRIALSTELGLDPPAELQRLLRQVLTGDPDLADYGRRARAHRASAKSCPSRRRD